MKVYREENLRVHRRPYLYSPSDRLPTTFPPSNHYEADNNIYKIFVSYTSCPHSFLLAEYQRECQDSPFTCPNPSCSKVSNRIVFSTIGQHFLEYIREDVRVGGVEGGSGGGRRYKANFNVRTGEVVRDTSTMRG